MNKYLIKLADHLDKKGLHKEADYVDFLIKRARSGRRELTQCPKRLIVKTRSFILHPLEHTDPREMEIYSINKSRFGLYELVNGRLKLGQFKADYEFRNLAELNKFLKEAKDEDLANKSSFIEKVNIPKICKERNKEDYSKTFEVRFEFKYSVNSYSNASDLFPYDEVANEVKISPDFIDEYKKGFNIKGDV